MGLGLREKIRILRCIDKRLGGYNSDLERLVNVCRGRGQHIEVECEDYKPVQEQCHQQTVPEHAVQDRVAVGNRRYHLESDRPVAGIVINKGDSLEQALADVDNAVCVCDEQVIDAE